MGHYIQIDNILKQNWAPWTRAAVKTAVFVDIGACSQRCGNSLRIGLDCKNSTNCWAARFPSQEVSAPVYVSALHILFLYFEFRPKFALWNIQYKKKEIILLIA